MKPNSLLILDTKPNTASITGNIAAAGIQLLLRRARPSPTSPNLSQVDMRDARLLKRLRDHTSLVDIDDRPGSYRLYLVSIEDPCICGVTGNCGIDIVEVEPGRIRIVGGASGWGYALVHREGPLGLPDVFLIQNMSAADSVVAGFANLGGEWGQLYCGAGENDHLDIKQCR